jgi:hypothetical protein
VDEVFGDRLLTAATDAFKRMRELGTAIVLELNEQQTKNTLALRLLLAFSHALVGHKGTCCLVE